VRRRWLARTTLAVALGIVIWAIMSLSQEAAAGADPPITAAQVTTDCDHGGPYPDQDVWIFEGPGAAPLEEATFTDDTGQVVVRRAAESAYDLAGHRLTWLTAPAGWSLTDIKPNQLKAVGACPAAVRETQPAGAVAKAASAGTGSNTDAAAGVANAQAQLPQTGQDVTSMVALGAALVITGVLLLFVRRKRPSPPPPAHTHGDQVWTYPNYSG
jgi:LPXTG-motif cell wall-anchored protein